MKDVTLTGGPGGQFPDLLEALKALHSAHRAFSSNDNWTVYDDDARAFAEKAIAKAEQG